MFVWKKNNRKVYTTYYLPTLEIKYSNIITDGQIFSDHRVKNNSRKISISQGDGYTAGYLLDYNYFNNYYKMINLSIQQLFDADPKEMQLINFTGNTAWNPVANVRILLKKGKKLF